MSSASKTTQHFMKGSLYETRLPYSRPSWFVKLV